MKLWIRVAASWSTFSSAAFASASAYGAAGNVAQLRHRAQDDQNQSPQTNLGELVRDSLRLQTLLFKQLSGLVSGCCFFSCDSLFLRFLLSG